MWNNCGSAILAGTSIAVGGFVYLVLGGVPGAIAFAFGLLTVVHYKLKLFTGATGYFTDRAAFKALWPMLLFNIAGCLLVALLSRVSPLGLQAKAQALLAGRLDTGWWQCGLLSIGCGFIVTTAVEFGRKGQFLPLLFGVPVFILCGFPHCIADAFYYLAVPVSYLADHFWSVLLLYVSIVAGNFIGGNLYRVVIKLGQGSVAN